MRKCIDKEAWKTSLQGYINVSYSNLVSKLGMPHGNDGYKVDAQWQFVKNGVVFIIYNYKTGKNYLGKKGKPIDKIKDWHIGGFNKKAVLVVQKLFPKSKVSTISY